ncbi:hypothetical protein AKL15_01995 [Corynebacterium glutamicum]|nr:hypothetical protein AUO96_09535 [Corynebacterium glutamicum]QDX74612.1 hypothetical protein AKL15_01995 [Corynebacterium glutamicum]QDX77374.1 hypothetical protein AKL16_02000 [Corynebacterium glutamicum]TWS34500.1 hypothetical protein AKJ19_08355 [Corynebacterium glutamicum]TWS38054.1 hypothetical protein AKJ20_00350 [Corynebacterium glutamicum]
MLGFNSQNEIDFADYMEGCHPGLGRTAYRRVYNEYAQDLVNTIPSGADFFAAMYHNVNDQEYYQSHHAPFVAARRDDLGIFERFEKDDLGHVPIPKDRLLGIIREFSNMNVDTRTAITQAGFQIA